MKKISEPIVFFGSGPVAADSLRLLAQDFEIECVITKPRPEHHKGDVPVLRVAEELGLKVLTAAKKSDLDDLVDANEYTSRVAVLIDFGIIVSKKVIDTFPLGIVNSHFSVLPEWRGADPITFAVLSGQPITGVSLMMLVEAMDEGDLIGYTEHPIIPETTTITLTKELIALSHALLCKLLPGYLENQKTVKQESTGRKVSYSRKLTKEDSQLDWNKPAARLEREVRAYLGWPRSRTSIGITGVVVTKAHVGPGQGVPGTLWLDNKQLGFHTSEGTLIIDRVIPAGKKEMPIAAFLSGYKV